MNKSLWVPIWIGSILLGFFLGKYAKQQDWFDEEPKNRAYLIPQHRDTLVFDKSKVIAFFDTTEGTQNFVYGPLRMSFRDGPVHIDGGFENFVNDTVFRDMQWPVWKLWQLAKEKRLYSLMPDSIGAVTMWYNGEEWYSTGIPDRSDNSVNIIADEINYSIKDFK